jgi:hypothetical protein
VGIGNKQGSRGGLLAAGLEKPRAERRQVLKRHVELAHQRKVRYHCKGWIGGIAGFFEDEAANRADL